MRKLLIAALGGPQQCSRCTSVAVARKRHKVHKAGTTAKGKALLPSPFPGITLGFQVSESMQ